MKPQLGFSPFVARIGQGPRKVLALHCTMAFSGAWGGLIRALSDDVQFIAPDMPSHGRSPDWDENSNFADTVYAGALATLDEPMDVIGHSFGGAVALRLAVERPDLVRSVTMIEPVFFCIAAMDDPKSLQDHDDLANPFYEAMKTGDREMAARTFNRMWSDGPKWPDMPQQVRDAMTRAIHVVPDTHGFLYEDSANLLPRLANVDIPALLVHGETSLDVTKTTNNGIARRLQNSDVVEIPGAGHMAPISHPKEVARHWRDFLAAKSAL